MPEPRLTYRQVAARLCIPQMTAYAIMREGGRGFFAVGADGRVREADLEAFCLEAIHGLTSAAPHTGHDVCRTD